MVRRISATLLLAALLLAVATPICVNAAGTTYYVANDGDDENDGLTPTTALATVGAVNALDLQPGDRVLLACGDTWRAEPLVIDAAGTEAEPIFFGSFPEDCAAKPILSGAQPITGWAPDSGHVYVADLGAGENAGSFPLGINQLFKDGTRLPFGRWPNLDANDDGGYAAVDGFPTNNQIVDGDLPAADWTGAMVHIKTERWLLINREVTASSGQTLTLNDALSCRGGTCAGWGYFINNHLATLDQDGEWYYDPATNRVYLYAPGGPSGTIEGAVILDANPNTRIGGLMLGASSPISYVVVDNLDIRDWFNYGISAPGSLRGDVYHHLAIRDCTIKDVDVAGVRLSTWISSADNGRDGLRGGHDLEFSGNVVDGANQFGITGYFYGSTFQDNEIKNIGLIANLGKAGMGCGTTGNSCTEYGDGLFITRYLIEDSGHDNVIRYNHIARTGYNGMDVFGPENTIEYNWIEQPCYSKGDCGGVRTFGNDNLASTGVYNLTFRNNIIVDSIGNVDGVPQDYHQLFGMGLYIDNYSRDVLATGNTIISSTFTGILFQRSTGQIQDNTVYNASSGSLYSGQVSLAGSETEVTDMSGNVLYGLKLNAWTLSLGFPGNLLASDYNYFFQPYVDKQITTGSWTGRKTLAEWQAYSGLDTHSRQNWFTLQEGEAPLSTIYYNTTRDPLVVDLGMRRYLDLDRNEVLGTITLQPFTSIVLIDDGLAPLSLLSMSPGLRSVQEASDFSLTLRGSGFTADSVVRWDGAGRPTVFVDSSQLTATVFAADVSTVAEIPVTVFDPSVTPGGAETPALIFHVVASIHRVYLPLITN